MSRICEGSLVRLEACIGFFGDIHPSALTVVLTPASCLADLALVQGISLRDTQPSTLGSFRRSFGAD